MRARARPPGRAPAASSSTATTSGSCTAPSSSTRAPARPGSPWLMPSRPSTASARRRCARATSGLTSWGRRSASCSTSTGCGSAAPSMPTAWPRPLGAAHPEHALVQGLFAPHFAEGRLLSDPDVLRDVAACGRPRRGRDGQGARGRSLRREVRFDEAAAQELDVTGVPYFLINGAWPIPGGPGRRDTDDRAPSGVVTPRPLRPGSRRSSPPSCRGAGRRNGPPSRPPTWSG